MGSERRVDRIDLLQPHVASNLHRPGEREIVLVTGRWDASQTLYPTMKLIAILKQFSDRITWVATKEGGIDYADDCVRLVEIPNRLVEEPFLANLGHHLLYQLRVTFSLLRTGNSLFVFAFSSDLFLLPILVVRALGGEVILRTDGRPSEILQRDQKRYSPLKVTLFRWIERLVYRLASRVLPESPGMIPLYGLAGYAHDGDSGALFVDADAFAIENPLQDRQFSVGFVGRLSEEKGILEFAEALSLLLTDRPGEKAIIIGDGDLHDMVASSIARRGISDSVLQTGKIDNRDLPRYLNEIRLIVIPSYYEGLPNILLEAMACGTPVLATPVGAIPDVIVDGRTGFIMENNPPECIAANMNRALASHELEQIAENARCLIELNYTFSAAVERYRRILGRPSPVY